MPAVYGCPFCIKDLAPISSLPLISGLTALEEYFSTTGLERVGVLGTRAVMESHLYGHSTVDVVSLPADKLQAAHMHYISMAVSGRATDEQRAFFENAATQWIDAHGAKAIDSVEPTSFWCLISLITPTASWIAPKSM